MASRPLFRNPELLERLRTELAATHRLPSLEAMMEFYTTGHIPYGFSPEEMFEHQDFYREFMASPFAARSNRPVLAEVKIARPTKPLLAIGNERRFATPNAAVSKFQRRKNLGLKVSTLIIPEKKVFDGTLIKETTIAWSEIAKTLRGNWSLAFQIPPEKWEEIIAGAYERAGYDEIVLTPRSGDYGRDVIATKHGIGCIKVVGSVKAYAPGNLVKHDDVRAFLHVLSAERDVSKGIITTTSDFAPRIPSDPFIKPYLPTRLELMNGERLQDWLAVLAQNSKRY